MHFANLNHTLARAMTGVLHTAPLAFSCTRHITVRRALTSVAALAFVCQATLAGAATEPPRRQSRSATGVSYDNGSFSFEQEDLSVAGGLPNGLSLTRNYNSATGAGSANYGNTPGWSHSFNIYLTISALPTNPTSTYPDKFPDQCIYNIAGGPRSVGFIYTGGARTALQTGCGPYVGSYEPINASGAKLEYLQENGAYHYRLTASDGAVLNFLSGQIARASDWTFADGTRLDFAYSTGVLKTVSSNRGWAVVFESPTKTCIVNTAQNYLAPGAACPADAQAAVYGYSPGTFSPTGNLLTSFTKDGDTQTYRYAGNDHVDCIVDPGQQACKITNTYSACPATMGFPQGNRLLDPVISQLDGSGRTYTYNFDHNSCPQLDNDPNPDMRAFTGNSVTLTETGIPGSAKALTVAGGNLASYEDPLGHVTTIAYQPSATQAGYPDLNETGDYDGQTLPEGNKVDLSDRDARGNILSTVTKAKPGSGLADIVTRSEFPATCSNIRTCNKPSSTSDAKNNKTEFTYDPNHGGVLTETSPPDVNGLRAVKRYAYIQRSAWLKTSGGGYAASPYPVWLISEIRICRTTATVGNACAGGAADETVTSYDYGPNSGPNNLLLRGEIVSADNEVHRTCFSYDRDGRRISTTLPNANLATCG